MKNLRQVFIWFTIASMCLFFVINGISLGLKIKVTNPFLAIDWIEYFAIVTVAFFGIAAFDVNGRQMGLWGCISSLLTSYIYYKYHLWTFVILYAYGAVLDFLLFLKGSNQVHNLKQKTLVFELPLILIIGTLLKIIIDQGLKFDTLNILELLTFVLYALGQLLALKQTIWQFAIWIPKNLVEFIIGMLQQNPVAIARNIYFLGMNIFAPINWKLQLKKQINDLNN